MTSDSSSASTQREPALVGQIVVLIDGSAGIGLETVRLARTDGGQQSVW